MHIAHLDRPNFALRALHPKGTSFGRLALIGGPTLGIRIVLIGPWMIKHPVMLSGLILALFAVAGTGLVAFTNLHTADRIAANERAALLRSLNALVPADTIDNDIVTDNRILDAPERLGGDRILVYFGRKQGRPVAAVFGSIVPDGYSGPMKLLVAVRTDGTLGGVRVVAHKETPGLGDKIELRKSDWILGFNDRSLANPNLAGWGVRRDGGVFDQFTGATVTPRSIVKAVKNTLLYFREHGERLFETPADAPPKTAGLLPDNQQPTGTRGQ